MYGALTNYWPSVATKGAAQMRGTWNRGHYISALKSCHILVLQR